MKFPQGVPLFHSDYRCVWWNQGVGQKKIVCVWFEAGTGDTSRWARQASPHQGWLMFFDAWVKPQLRTGTYSVPDLLETKKALHSYLLLVFMHHSQAFQTTGEGVEPLHLTYGCDFDGNSHHDWPTTPDTHTLLSHWASSVDRWSLASTDGQKKWWNKNISNICMFLFAAWVGSMSRCFVKSSTSGFLFLFPSAGHFRWRFQKGQLFNHLLSKPFTAPINSIEENIPAAAPIWKIKDSQPTTLFIDNAWHFVILLAIAGRLLGGGFFCKMMVCHRDDDSLSWVLIGVAPF